MAHAHRKASRRKCQRRQQSRAHVKNKKDKCSSSVIMCKMNRFVVGLLSIHMISVIPNKALAQRRKQRSQRSVLKTFYLKCEGDNWSRNDNWMERKNDICEWYGVTCSDEFDIDFEEYAVTGLSLPDNNIECNLPPILFQLPYLEYLNLGTNKKLDVNFQFMNSRVDAEKLGTLILNHTGLSSLSGIADAARNLEVLVLAGNDLTGNIPVEVFSLGDLQSLDLSNNHFTGTIPPQLGRLNKLQTLLISNNILTGGIPRTIGTLRDLSILDLSNNILSGTLPTEMNSLKNMATLTLHFQRDSQGAGLTGKLIDFASMPRLSLLNLSNNRLTGGIPTTFLSSVDPSSFFTTIDISANEVEGDVPATLARFKILRIYMSDNLITGLDSTLCQRGHWFFNEVAVYGCDAILCPPGTYSTYGRQVSNALPCTVCPGGGDEAPYYGTTQCGKLFRESDSHRVRISHSEDGHGRMKFEYSNSDDGQGGFSKTPIHDDEVDGAEGKLNDDLPDTASLVKFDGIVYSSSPSSPPSKAKVVMTNKGHDKPSLAPSASASGEPSFTFPTEAPITEEPSNAPSYVELEGGGTVTEKFTQAPSVKWSQYPTTFSSSSPTKIKSSLPSTTNASVTVSPSISLTQNTSGKPSKVPSAYPSSPPSVESTQQPTLSVTQETNSPVYVITKFPSMAPATRKPTVSPTTTPTITPTTTPTTTSTSVPTKTGTAAPTVSSVMDMLTSPPSDGTSPPTYTLTTSQPVITPTWGPTKSVSSKPSESVTNSLTPEPSVPPSEEIINPYLFYPLSSSPTATPTATPTAIPEEIAAPSPHPTGTAPVEASSPIMEPLPQNNSTISQSSEEELIAAAAAAASTERLRSSSVTSCGYARAVVDGTSFFLLTTAVVVGLTSNVF